MFEQVKHKQVYEEVVEEIAARIQNGTLAVGQKLLSRAGTGRGDGR